MPLAHRLFRGAALALGVVLATTPASAARLILAPTADTFIRSDTPDTNQGASNLIIVGDTATADTALRGLLSFNLAQPALTGATIQGVELQLTISGRDTASGGSLNAAHTLRLHPLGESYAENSATWINRLASTPWSQPGGTWQTTILASATANPGTVNAGDLVAFRGPALTEAVAAAARAGAGLDLLVKLATEDAVRSVFRFDSRGSASAQPLLIIDYTAAAEDPVSAATPVPGHPERPLSSRYSVVADGRPVEVRAERFSFDVAMFTLPADTPVTVEVGLPPGTVNWSLRPARHGLVATRQGDTLRFTLDRPLRLVLQADAQTPLALLVTPTETNVPSPGDPNVIYFPPGITDAGVIRPLSGQTIYLAPGALVKGRIEAKDVSNISIRGRGILESTNYAARSTGLAGILVERCRHVVVEGIGLRSHYTWWQTLFLNSRDLELAHLNIFGLGVNTDGVDIDGVRDFLVRDSFIRAEDDGLGWHSLDAVANGEPITERARATDLVIWNTGAGNGIRIGASMETQLWRDITIENTDILMHAGAGIYSDFSDWAWAENLVFRNITIDRPTQPITFKILRTIYSNATGFLDERGHYEGLVFENIRMNGGPITLAGYDADHLIDRVYFNQCVNAGVAVTSPAQIVTNAYVRNVFFNQTVPSAPPPPPGRHEAEHQESSTNARPQITFADPTLTNSKGRRLLAAAIGDHVEYALELPAAGAFRLALGVRRGPGAGRFRLDVDGVPLDGEHDLHADLAAPDVLDLGLVSVPTAGTRRLRLTVSGKNPLSTGHALEVDYFHFTPALEAFRALHFGSDTDPALSADSADPDGDGLPNLVEYALGGDPWRAEPARLVASVADARLALSFTPAVIDGLIYHAQVSSDLTTWTDTTLGPLRVGVPFTHLDAIALAPGQRRFLRLSVSPADPGP